MSLAERIEEQTCSACQTSHANADHHGDKLCPGCDAVFQAARTLLEHSVAAEEELIPTLVFARISGRSRDPHYRQHYRSGYGPVEDGVLAGEHPGLEIVRFLDNLPVVRVKPLILDAEKHPGTQVLKQVRIRTLSKKVGPADVAQRYEQLLNEEGARWNENNHGGFSYDCLHGYLELIVTEGTEVSPDLEKAFGEDLFRHPAFHFPPPDIVAGVHEAIRATFANRLDLYGKPQRKTPSKLIPAFTAWHIGGIADNQVPPSSRPTVSRALNRHLLAPSKLPELPADTWTSADTIWNDVRVLLPRFINIQQFAIYLSHRS